MNIENNENQNINIINYNFNYSKFVSITKKMIFFLFIFFILIFPSYQIYCYSRDLLRFKSQKFDNIFGDYWTSTLNFIYYKRNLNNQNMSDILTEKSINSTKNNGNGNISITNKINTNINQEYINIRNKYNGDYAFILNLTSNEYLGNWSKFAMTQSNFFEKKINQGIAELYFYKIKNGNNFIINLSKEKNNAIRIDVILREGKYIDKYYKINFTFYINDNIERLLKTNDTIILNNNSTKLDFYKIVWLRNKKKEKIEKGNVTLILEKEDYSYASSYKKRIMSPFYNVKLTITSQELNVTINTEINDSDILRQKVRIYSFILSILGIIEIFHILKLIMKINDHHEIGNRLSILSITISCHFKVVIFIMHFFLSISTTDEDMSYQFGVPTIIYFFCFTGFELKLLIITFRARNNELGNQEIYRKRILCLYFFMFISLTFTAFNLKECLTNFALILFIYTFSWLTQIIFSIINNSRPPMSRMYIICLSLSRLYLPIYIKGIDNNIFDLKPSYFKVSLLIIITFIEVIILLLQKSFGARTILPKKYRNKGFDYYKDKVNIEMHISKNPNCVICLESLSVEVDENFNTIQKKEKAKTNCSKLMHLCFLDKIKKKIERWLKNMEGKSQKKKYMITPCDHVFHSICLERWMRQKNECPYCKAVIPSLE